jgi:hemoglobin
LASAAETTPNTPFYKLGGHETMQAIVDRFYDLMDSDPAYAELRAMHAPDLAKMRKALALFLAGWSGGPRDWFDENPGRCMMSVHKPYVISRPVAEQWAAAMKRAIGDVAPDDKELARAMGEVLEQLALGMANA